MAQLERSELIALLDRLGAEDDETVLEAARRLHREVTDSGFTWDDLLSPDDDPDKAVDEDDEDDEEVQADHTDDEGEEENEDALAKAAPDDPVHDAGEEARLIDRLLARKDLSEAMRGELTDLKNDIADGDFTVRDQRYVRALAKRIDA